MTGWTGVLPWVRAAGEYAVAIMQYNTGGEVFQGRVKGGVVPVITSGGRTHAEQVELYATKESNPYPVAVPGDSSHEYGLGFDSVVPEKWMPLWVAVRRYVGFYVPDNDLIHANVPNWRSYVGR